MDAAGLVAHVVRRRRGRRHRLSGARAATSTSARNVRGTGKSDGGGSDEWDFYDLIEWIAAQPWCDGNVGMIGISAFGGAQFHAAAQQPPHLKAIFPYDSMGCFGQWGFRDFYPGGLIHTMVFLLDGWRRLSRQPRPARAAAAGRRQQVARGDRQCRLHDVSEHLQRARRKGADHAARLRHAARAVRRRRHRREDGRAFKKIKIPFYTGSGWYAYTTSSICRARSSGSRTCRAYRRSCCSPVRRIWSGRSIPSTTRSCAGTTTGSRARTPASSTSRRSRSGSWARTSGATATTGRCRKPQWTKLYLPSWGRLRAEPDAPGARTAGSSPTRSCRCRRRRPTRSRGCAT